MIKWADIDFRGRNSGTVKTTCPACSVDRRNKKDLCLSVDIDRGVYNCHHCGEKGRKEGYVPKKQEPVVLPKLNTTGLSEKMFAYFQSRHISTTTIKRNNITEGSHYIGQEGKETNCIWFNYFKGGQHVNTKFRTAKKQFTQVKNAPKHFYKIDDVKDVAIITEGEFDALSYEEAGFNYAISVPDGALPPNANYSDTKFEYIDNDIDVLLGCEKIYLSIDSDAAGQHLQRELSRRIGREKCFLVDLKGYKDANEVLCHLGRVDGLEWLKTCLNEAKPYPIEGMQTVDRFVDGVIDIYDNGFDTGCGVGMADTDTHIRWTMALLYIVTGIPSHGKSSWLDQIAVRLMERADWKFAVYSPEHDPKLHLQRLVKILLRQPFFGKGRMGKQELTDALGWLNERIFYIMPDNEDFSLDNILSIGRQLIAQKGVNCLIIDPWNTLETSMSKGENETQYVSRCLTKMKQFAQRNDSSVVLVAHPSKARKNEDGTYEIPTGYNISGSANFFNKADMGITIYRDEVKQTSHLVTWKVKFEDILGKKGMVDYWYDKETSTYNEINSNSSHEEKTYEKTDNSLFANARPSDFDDLPF